MAKTLREDAGAGSGAAAGVGGSAIVCWRWETWVFLARKFLGVEWSWKLSCWIWCWRGGGRAPDWVVRLGWAAGGRRLKRSRVVKLYPLRSSCTLLPHCSLRPDCFRLSLLRDPRHCAFVPAEVGLSTQLRTRLARARGRAPAGAMNLACHNALQSVLSGPLKDVSPSKWTFRVMHCRRLGRAGSRLIPSPPFGGGHHNNIQKARADAACAWGTQSPGVYPVVRCVRFGVPGHVWRHGCGKRVTTSYVARETRVQEVEGWVDEKRVLRLVQPLVSHPDVSDHKTNQVRPVHQSLKSRQCSALPAVVGMGWVAESGQDIQSRANTDGTAPLGTGSSASRCRSWTPAP